MAHIEKATSTDRGDFLDPVWSRQLVASRPRTPYPAGPPHLFDPGPANAIDRWENRVGIDIPDYCRVHQQENSWSWLSERVEYVEGCRNTSEPRPAVPRVKEHAPALGNKETVRDASSDAGRYAPSQACYSDRLVMFEGVAVRSDYQRSHWGAKTVVSDDQKTSAEPDNGSDDGVPDSRDKTMLARILVSQSERALEGWVREFMSRAEFSQDFISQISTHLRRECWHELFIFHGAGLPEGISFRLRERALKLSQQMKEQRSEQESMGVADSHPVPLQVITYREYLPRLGLEAKTRQQEQGTRQWDGRPFDAAPGAQ